MKVSERFHLTYCSNIHPGETWEQVSASLAAALPRIRALLGHEGPLAIGLRLSAQAAQTLAAGDALARFRDFLRAGDYYVPTINGFPYGAFHGERVKERVYLPDWRDNARVEYTNLLATLLSELLADRPDIEGSVSTAPGAFRVNIQSADDVSAMAKGFLRHAEHLRRIDETTGRKVTLAIEPEPACYIETVDDALVFFRDYLFEADVRRYIGICLDASHMAVEFEEPLAAMRRLEDAGIRICKFQISSALRVDSARRRALERFADDTYLHQVVERASGGVTRYTDLPDALSATREVPRDAEWRVHYHVPIFLGTLGDLGTTQPDLVVLLDALKHATPSPNRSPCLEVETYTWDVLPPEHRHVDVCTAIARELTWVRRRLES